MQILYSISDTKLKQIIKTINCFSHFKLIYCSLKFKVELTFMEEYDRPRHPAWHVMMMRCIKRVRALSLQMSFHKDLSRLWSYVETKLGCSTDSVITLYMNVHNSWNLQFYMNSLSLSYDSLKNVSALRLGIKRLTSLSTDETLPLFVFLSLYRHWLKTWGNITRKCSICNTRSFFDLAVLRRGHVRQITFQWKTKYFIHPLHVAVSIGRRHFKYSHSFTLNSNDNATLRFMCCCLSKWSLWQMFNDFRTEWRRAPLTRKSIRL